MTRGARGILIIIYYIQLQSGLSILTRVTVITVRTITTYLRMASHDIVALHESASAHRGSTRMQRLVRTPTHPFPLLPSAYRLPLSMESGKPRFRRIDLGNQKRLISTLQRFPDTGVDIDWKSRCRAHMSSTISAAKPRRAISMADTKRDHPICYTATSGRAELC